MHAEDELSSLFSLTIESGSLVGVTEVTFFFVSVCTRLFFYAFCILLLILGLDWIGLDWIEEEEEEEEEEEAYATLDYVGKCM